MGIARPAFGLGGNFKGLSEQRVTGKDGDAFTENFVIGRFAPAEIVVVHRGQIIVDERIGVDAFDGAGEWHGCFYRAAASFGCGEANGRAHPFSPGENRVTHRLMNGGWLRAGARQKVVQGAVDGNCSLFQIFFKIKTTVRHAELCRQSELAAQEPSRGGMGLNWGSIFAGGVLQV